MIQRVLKVKSTDTRPTKDGKKTYLSVVLTNGSKESKLSIFDTKLQTIFQEAKKNSQSLNVGFEKEGNFWNVKTAKVTTQELSPSETTKTNGRFYHDRHSQDAEDWTNIRTAVMQAMALECKQEKTDINRVMENAGIIFADMNLMKPKREEKNAS